MPDAGQPSGIRQAVQAAYPASDRVGARPRRCAMLVHASAPLDPLAARLGGRAGAARRAGAGHGESLRRSPFRAISAPIPRPASSGGTRPARCRRPSGATASRSRSFAPRPALPSGIRAGSRRTSCVFAHAALTDLAQRRLRHDERIARSGFGIAEAARRRHRRRAARLALPARRRRRAQPLSSPRMPATGAGFGFDLALETTQPVLLQGVGGLSRKGPRPEQSSRYYSQPQLAVARHAERRRRVACRSPAAPGSTTSGATPSSMPTRSAGTGSA